MDRHAFFADRREAQELFDALQQRVEAFGPVDVAATKSRVSFVRRTRFCWVHEAGLHHIWIGFHLARGLDSPRVRSGRRGAKWSHHLKITSEDDMDAELMAWLREAYELDAPQ